MARFIDNKVLGPDDGLSGWVVKNNQIVRIGNVSEDPRYCEAYPGMTSGLYVPPTWV